MRVVFEVGVEERGGGFGDKGDHLGVPLVRGTDSEAADSAEIMGGAFDPEEVFVTRFLVFEEGFSPFGGLIVDGSGVFGSGDGEGGAGDGGVGFGGDGLAESLGGDCEEAEGPGVGHVGASGGGRIGVEAADSHRCPCSVAVAGHGDFGGIDFAGEAGGFGFDLSEVVEDEFDVGGPTEGVADELVA